MDPRIGGGGPVHHAHHHHHHPHAQERAQAPTLPSPPGMAGDAGMAANAGWEQNVGAAAVPLPPGGMAQQVQELRQMLVQLNQRVAELAEQNAALQLAALHQQVAAVVAPAAAGGAQPYKVFAPGPVPLEGFDNGKLNDPGHRTVKYLFGRVASNYPLDGVKDKAGAEALLNRMKPDLIAAGLDVKDVKGDKILVNTPIGDEWVDVVRGAGSGNPGWWWGSEGQAVPGSTPGPAQIPLSPAGAAPTPAAVDGEAAPEPGPPLASVKLTPAMKKAADEILAAKPGLKNDPGELTKEVAAYVKRTMPDLLPKGDNRQAAFDTMTQVIGIIRSMGIDAFRVVNHPTIEGNPVRVGSDSVVINGQIYDVFRAFGEASEPVNQNVGPWDKDRAKGLRE